MVTADSEFFWAAAATRRLVGQSCDGCGWTAIAGIGQTEFSKNAGRSELQLAAESITAALADCGLQARSGATRFGGSDEL
jgi:hypothetical protein